MIRAFILGVVQLWLGAKYKGLEEPKLMSLISHITPPTPYYSFLPIIACISKLPTQTNPSDDQTTSSSNTETPSSIALPTNNAVVESVARIDLITGVTTHTNSHKTFSYTNTDGSLIAEIFLPPIIGEDLALIRAYTSILNKQSAT